MSRLGAALIVFAATLAAASDALAHGGMLVEQVCGPAGCRLANGNDGIYVFEPHDVLEERAAAGVASPPPFAPYYELRARDRPPGRPHGYFVPTSGLIRAATIELGGRSAWIKIAPSAIAELRETVRDLEPFPPPELDSVSVGALEAREPQRYSVLYDPLPRAELPSPYEQRVSVVLRSTPSSPWTDGEGRLDYVPSLNVLIRGEGLGEAFRLPAGTVTLLEHPERGAAGGRWWYAAGAGGTAALLLAIGLVAARLKRTSRRAPPPPVPG